MIYEKDTIVIGSTLPALIYAYCQNLPILSAKIEPPHLFERFLPSTELKWFGLENKPEVWKSPDGKTKTVGIEKWILWQRLWSLLSISGLNPITDKAESLIIRDNVVSATIGGILSKYSFKNLLIFSDSNIVNLPPPDPTVEIKKVVFDYFRITKRSEIPFDFMEIEGELCKELLFHNHFTDHRVPLRKDVVGISIITDEQLQQEEFSDIEARFKVRYFFDKIFQPDKWNIKVKIEQDGREIIPERMKQYYDTKNMTFMYDTDEHLIEFLEIVDSPITRLLGKLNNVN